MGGSGQGEEGAQLCVYTPQEYTTTMLEANTTWLLTPIVPTVPFKVEVYLTAGITCELEAVKRESC